MTTYTRLPAATLERCADALRVLAHADRLRIVEQLEQRRLTVGELAERIDLPPAAVSQHLNLMRAHGLLSVERRGRLAYYRATSPHALAVLRCIRRHAAPSP
jgi:DNA-binding transcriptional ArsR family regulator